MIWILTASFGDGHNTAARSVAEALLRRRPDESVEVTDLIAEEMPRLASVLQSAYQVAIIRFPFLWRRAYAQLAKPGLSRRATGWLQPLLAAIRIRLETQKPRAIICTYPAYSKLLEMLRDQGVTVPPLITVVTDSISIHPIWTAGFSDAYCVPDNDTKLALESLGVAADKVHATGFPVSLAFADLVIRTNQGQQILYLPSTTTGHVAHTLEALAPLLLAGVKLTLPVGKHGQRLHHVIRHFTDANPSACVEVIGWTDKIPFLLQTHDVVICKAGGAILHEVLAARIPAVIDYVVPGQEEGNAELLLRHHCARLSKTPQETAEYVGQILADGGVLGQTMREAMTPLSEPEAALRIAEVVDRQARPL